MTEAMQGGRGQYECVPPERGERGGTYVDDVQRVLAFMQGRDGALSVACT
ncbi:hypothetical protein ACRJ4W_01570 [Streptomyces sp. GLT-R25]